MKTFSVILGLLVLPLFCVAQDKDSLLTAHIQSNVFGGNDASHKTHRKFMSLKNKSLVAKLNPVLYVGAGLMYFYQNVVSEQIQAECTYKVSCSEFTKKSIESKGFVKGTLEGLNQLYNCFPGAEYERCEYLITGDGKINNQLDAEN